MEFILWLQSRLTSHGFSPGPIDGIAGPLTTAAITAFQRSRGLPITGTSTAATVEALRASSTGEVPRPVVTAKPAPVPNTPPRNNWPTQAGVPSFFGKPGENLQLFELPFPLKLSWDTGTVVRRMTLHKAVGASAQRALAKVSATYSEREITALGLDLFGGSYNHRVMRGGAALSMHAYGIAIDFDPVRNGMNTKAPQARLSHADALPFWHAWEAEGWVSLGRARNFDWMHVQAAKL